MSEEFVNGVRLLRTTKDVQKRVFIELEMFGEKGTYIFLIFWLGDCGAIELHPQSRGVGRGLGCTWISAARKLAKEQLIIAPKRCVYVSIATPEDRALARRMYPKRGLEPQSRAPDGRAGETKRDWE